MADGKLICAGSPVFLKSRFTNGYYLTMVKQSSETDVDTLTKFIKNYIKEASLMENVGSEVAYVLPMAASRDGRFEALFEALDASLGYLEISSYGARDTSLEVSRRQLRVHIKRYFVLIFRFFLSFNQLISININQKPKHFAIYNFLKGEKISAKMRNPNASGKIKIHNN